MPQNNVINNVSNFKGTFTTVNFEQAGMGRQMATSSIKMFASVNI